jgi:hypothetical protein
LSCLFYSSSSVKISTSALTGVLPTFSGFRSSSPNLSSNKNQFLPSPFLSIERGSTLTYSPIVFLPNREWFEELKYDFISINYIPQILVNGQIILKWNTSSFAEYKKSGAHWNPTESALNEVEFQLWDKNGTLIVFDLLDLHIVINTPPIFDIRDTELHFGLIDDFVSHDNNQTSGINYILYPDGFLMKYQTDNKSQRIERFATYVSPKNYTWAVNQLSTRNFFNFKNNYFNEFESTNKKNYFISFRIWNPDGTFDQVTKFFSGSAVPNVVKDLWNNLYIFASSNDVNLTIRTESVQQYFFVVSGIAIPITLRKKKNRKGKKRNK